jgi:hypothetical protein
MWWAGLSMRPATAATTVPDTPAGGAKKMSSRERLKKFRESFKKKIEETGDEVTAGKKLRDLGY